MLSLFLFGMLFDSNYRLDKLTKEAIEEMESDRTEIESRIDILEDEWEYIKVEPISVPNYAFTSPARTRASEIIINSEELQKEIEEEIEDGEKELLAQLIEAEAGNQDYTGKLLVADVVLNRVDSSKFPDTIEEVIFEKHQSKDGKWHWQFSTVMDGAFDMAAYYISEDSFRAAAEEYDIWKSGAYVSSPYILSFTAGGYNKYFKPAFKHGDHYFGT